MALSDDLIKELKRKFEISTTTQFRYRSNAVVVQSDKEGNPSVFLLGKSVKAAPLKATATAELC